MKTIINDKLPCHDNNVTMLKIPWDKAEFLLPLFSLGSSQCSVAFTFKGEHVEKEVEKEGHMYKKAFLHSLGKNTMYPLRK